MKKIILILAIAFVGCNDSAKRPEIIVESDSTYKEINIPTDSIDKEFKEQNDRIKYELDRIDSNLKYYQLAQKYERKVNEMQIRYLQTEDEKYHRLFDKYEAIRVKYVRLCNKYSISKYNKEK